MLTRQPCARTRQRGTTLIEVMVSILITALGLLALAGLQTRMNAALMESNQRAHALTLLQDMTQRMQANMNQAAAYVTGTADPRGTGDAAPGDCSTLAAPTRADLDLCEWSNALKGSHEVKDTASVGAMIGALGCVEQVQAPNPAAGVCQPGVYRVTISWQGFNSTVAPAVSCGADQYGSDDALRKAVSSSVVVPLQTCS
ncbi:MAG TPA: type IV pilus modification protein PilV [Ramlibacter sp.]|uniref:type IV pilus modification protein PilV n=1 Tax=Ramlibacter sp. TaxID=1917967 RepID=UPI002D80BEA7|nr:type IV pilus modification protein PilV [Ramlibacter sp.]HET8744146.1 type IV pilus modification protein PilV [Ramlibacter sp.]